MKIINYLLLINLIFFKVSYADINNEFEIWKKNFKSLALSKGISENTFNLTIKDDSSSTSALALQGPNSRKILNVVAQDSLDQLKFFWMVNTKIGDCNVLISRTGYTGDLGYELWIEPKDSLTVWDTLIEKGIRHLDPNVKPFYPLFSKKI